LRSESCKSASSVGSGFDKEVQEAKAEGRDQEQFNNLQSSKI